MLSFITILDFSLNSYLCTLKRNHSLFGKVSSFQSEEPSTPTVSRHFGVNGHALLGSGKENSLKRNTSAPLRSYVNVLNADGGFPNGIQ